MKPMFCLGNRYINLKSVLTDISSGIKYTRLSKDLSKKRGLIIKKTFVLV